VIYYHPKYASDIIFQKIVSQRLLIMSRITLQPHGESTFLKATIYLNLSRMNWNVFLQTVQAGKLSRANVAHKESTVILNGSGRRLIQVWQPI